VYLDLMHWIGLAKAATGHRDGDRYRGLLDEARVQQAKDAFVFPLSGQHYMEMAGIRDPRQRGDIARVMEELSGFTTLLSRVDVMRLELEAALDNMTRRPIVPYPAVPVLGVGFGHAFGLSGQLRIRDTDGDVTDSTRATWPEGPEAFDAWLSQLQRLGERMMLAGPKDHDHEKLKSLGYDAQAARVGQERRAQQEREQAARFDRYPRFRRGRTRDAVAARYVGIELLDMLNEGLANRGVRFDEFDFDRASARRFVDSMPGSDVHVTLQTAAHRNASFPWEPNDFFDIDALALATPYSDIVGTERKWAHVLNSSGCAKRLDTRVVVTPEELASLLRGP
jgi:hypothetical protein